MIRVKINSKLTLLSTVLISVGSLVLLSVGSMLLLHLLTTKSIVSDLTGRLVKNNLAALELALRGHLNPAKIQAEFIAEAIRSGELEFNDREMLAKFVLGSLAATPQISVLVVASSDETTIRVSRTDLGELERDWPDLDQNSQLILLSREIESRKEPYWGPPIFSDYRNETLLNLRMPVWEADKYLGFIAVGISTQALSEFVLELSEPPRSTVFVLYDSDRVLAHMYLALKPHGLSSGNPLLATNEIIDPVIGHLGEATPFSGSFLELPEGINALELVSGELGYIVITKNIFGYSDESFVIGSYAVASTVDAPFRTMSRAIMIGVGLLTLALVFSLFISRKIARPVRETSASVAAVASMDVESISPLPESRIKEINDLSNSFNAMLVGLKAFGRYVPHALVNRLIRENRVGAGTEERNLTVMFTDIVGFTSTCEGMSPSEVANFVNHHITIVSQCIEHEGGTIDKYIGDAVMAFWGAPDSIDDAPVRAVRAAIAIQSELAKDNVKRGEIGLLPVRIRIGIHSGLLIVGDIGAPKRINYTVVGDVVNAAQRLEALGKEIDSEAETIILVSGASKYGLNDEFTLLNVGRYKVKGKHKELDVYRVLS